MKKNKKEKNIINPLILNETMVNIMIKNIISYAVRQSNAKRIYKQINEHCFNYLQRLINQYLLTEFIPHENLSDRNNEENKIYFNLFKNSKCDSGIFIKEPETTTIDRFSDKVNIIKENDDINNENIIINKGKI